MRNDNWLKGEFFFKALVRRIGVRPQDDPPYESPFWDLSTAFFSSYEDAKKAYNEGHEIKWPAEDLDGVVFCPDPEELESRRPNPDPPTVRD